MSNTPLPEPAFGFLVVSEETGQWIGSRAGEAAFDADNLHAHAAAVSAAKDAEIAGLREASKSALLVLCALRDANDWHRNMVKDIDFAIEAARAALGDKTPNVGIEPPRSGRLE